MSYTPEVQNFTSVLNSTYTGLTAGETFLGVGEDVEKWGTISVSVFTPFGVSTNGTLYMEVSRDGVNWGGPPRTFSDTSTAQPHMWTVAEKYFRVRYVNGSIPTGPTFSIQTQYSVNRPIQLAHQLDEVLKDETEAIATKSVIVGKDPLGNYINERTSGYAFFTQDALGTGSSVSSSILSTEGYSQIQTELFADTPGTLLGQWYDDVNGSKLIRTFTRPYTSSDVSNGLVYFSSPVFGPYLKYSYVNGASAQSNFYLGLKFLNIPISGQVLGLNDFIPKAVVANLGRNVIVGQDDAGNFRNVPVDSEGHIMVHIDEPQTGFGELRVAQPFPLAQVDFVYGINTNLGVTGSSGGSITSSDALMTVSTGATSNSFANYSTRGYLKYRPGQGGLIRFTSIFSTGATGSFQLAGIGDSANGYFFGLSGPEFGIFHRSNSSDTFIPQTSWNYDNFDGSGSTSNPSKVLLDPTKGNVYQIQTTYLGFGNIFFFIMADDGSFKTAHIVQYPNSFTSPLVRNPSMPILFEARNLSNTSVLSVKTASCAIFLDGHRRLLGPKYGFDNNKTGLTALSNVFSIRNATTFNGVPNKAQIHLRSISFAAEGATSPATFQLIRGASVSGNPSWQPISGTGPTATGASVTGQSCAFVDTAGTTVSLSSGIFLYNLILARQSGAVVDVSDLDIFINPGETLTFAAKSLRASEFSVGANWIEDI